MTSSFSIWWMEQVLYTTLSTAGTAKEKLTLEHQNERWHIAKQQEHESDVIFNDNCSSSESSYARPTEFPTWSFP